MNQRMLISAVILSAGVTAFADDTASRSKLIGNWSAQTPHAAWAFDQGTGGLKVVHSEGNDRVSEFECNTSGRECKIKDAGKAATVSMWFSGPKLVQMETRGSDVVKRRFSVIGEGDTLELEIIPVVPAGKPETLQFKRVQATASGASHPD